MIPNPISSAKSNIVVVAVAAALVLAFVALFSWAIPIMLIFGGGYVLWNALR